MDTEALRQWLNALDSISYYELFGVEAKTPYDDLRRAFHVFAESFHPDAHRWRHPNEQAAIGRIYRRGMEAWRVLSDVTLRARYDEALKNGILRPENLIVEADGPPSMGRRPAGPAAADSKAPLVDKIRSPGARPFVMRAEELLKKGDPKQAKIQLVMAMHMDRGNAALEAFGKQLDEAIAAKAEADKKSWNK
ncbi:MAG: DnaJ domain-containing protein [Labilithrix sp.]|nr:DnaJ domain-containing protein [Labilithrix sp.]MCW5814447.1 DnaJ domain-containing protein [Labilithrix sp.]